MALKDDVLKVLTTQMGPAAGPFLDRQCKARLQKEAGAITKADIPELAKWVGIGAKLTLGDAVGASLSKDILSLG
jgi:hypothetical protein